VPTGFDSELERYGLDRRYVDAVHEAGGRVLLIPVPLHADRVLELAAGIDGLLLPGSPTDVDPARYGEKPHPRLGRLFPERDETDFLLLEQAEGRGLPVLGICHGMQTLNVWRGGSLLQHLEPGDAAIRHQNPGRPRDLDAHEVEITSPSLLAGLVGARLAVNSFHHQAVDRAGRDLVVVARASDGIAEAIEETGRPFVLGVQWHPEASRESSEASRRLFGAFVRAAAALGID
jgi:putative glutamine amidotransferase